MHTSTMPATKKRRVTFDPEIRPSSACSPPPLAFAHYPAIVTKKDIRDVINLQPHAKSILKNPPEEDKPYDSLCNVLIDLPPPPTTGLLSFEMIQQETVFKPKNRFSEILQERDNQVMPFGIDDDTSSSEEEEEEGDSSDEESDEDSNPSKNPEFGKIESFNDDTVNEDDLLVIEKLGKPKTFESSLILEQNIDERVFFIVPDNENNNHSLSTANNEADVDSDKEDANYSLNSREEINECIPSPEARSVSQTSVYISSTLDRDENLESNILENLEEQQRVPETFVSTMTADIAEICYPDCDENAVKIINENIPQLGEVSKDVHVITTDNKQETRNNHENETDKSVAEEYEVHIGEDFAKTLITSELLLRSESPTLTTNTLRPHLDNSLIDPFLSSSQSISSAPTNNILPGGGSIGSDETHNEALLKLNSTNSSNNFAEQVVLQNIQAACDDKEVAGKSISSSSLSNPFPDNKTNVGDSVIPLNSRIVFSDSLTTVDSVTEQSETKNRRKTSKKGHRKHSKSSRTKEAQASTTPSVVEITIAQDQRAALAQARFKRYMAKMSGKATAETQNLNYAGEPETLEPHMRDSIKESQILIWIYNMIDEAARVDFEFFLKDGCILCKLMNRIVPGCIPENEITWEGARSKQKNIANFLREAEKYGVPKAKLFFPEDLLHLRHVPRVTRCIYALAKIAQQDPKLGEETPQLGDEPSFLKETTTKIVIPGHRDTKDITAQLTAQKAADEEAKAKKTKHSLYK